MRTPVLSEPRVTIYVEGWYAAQDRARKLRAGPLKQAALRYLEALEDGWGTMRKLQRACDAVYADAASRLDATLDALWYVVEVEIVDRYRGICAETVACVPGSAAGALPDVPLDDLDAESLVLGRMMRVLALAVEHPGADPGFRTLIRETAEDALHWTAEIPKRGQALFDAIEAARAATRRRRPRE
ncbi:MAG TPA: hypothetical protein VHG91_15375 [Longimicrobium sp.]|nr:hypothetical protein [Longimicrobium sp.]